MVLWWLADDAALVPEVKRLIVDETTDVVVSAASVWEIAIKHELGKLTAPDDLLDQLDHSRFEVTPLTGEDLWLAGHLPRHHNDPFDRAIVAQAMRARLRVATRDTRFGSYGVDVMEA